MISSKELTRRFDDFTAVDKVSFEIASGSICALLGPNGAGKSTIVKMLTGLLAPSSGAAAVAGLDVAKQPDQVKQAIGVVPENLGLFDMLTVSEHLDLAGSVYGIPATERRKRADDLIHTLALENGRDTFAGECSHGMRKKTALALALIHDPRVLFLDEPFEGIDPVTSRTIQNLIVELARRGVTILLTAHILPIVETLAQRILFLRKGALVWDSAQSGMPESLEEHYFDLVEAPPQLDLPWLGSRRS